MRDKDKTEDYRNLTEIEDRLAEHRKKITLDFHHQQEILANGLK